MSIKDDLFSIVREEVEAVKSKSPAPELLCISYGERLFLGRLDMNFLIVYNIDYSNNLETLLKNVIDEVKSQEVNRVSIGRYIEEDNLPNFLRNGSYSRRIVHLDDNEFLQGYFKIENDKLVRIK